MTYAITYSDSFDRHSLKHIARADLLRIQKTIEEKLTVMPDIFGKPLHGSWKGFWSLRVGIYRVIYCIEKQNVRIYLIGKRSTIYEDK